MSAKVDILAFASAFAGIAVDQPLLDADFDDTILALDPTEFLVTLELQEHDVGNASYRVPPSAIRLLAVWFDDRQLGHAEMTQLESVTPRWRDAVGSPIVFVTETEGDRMFRLYPAPDTASKAFSFPSGLPFGRDFPRYAVASAQTEARTDLPDWLDLPVALAMLARTFAREERYRDPTFVSVVRRMADKLLMMVA